MAELMKKDMKGKVILSASIPALDVDASYIVLKAQPREVGTFHINRWCHLNSVEVLNLTFYKINVQS